MCNGKMYGKKQIALKSNEYTSQNHCLCMHVNIFFQFMMLEKQAPYIQQKIKKVTKNL